MSDHLQKQFNDLEGRVEEQFNDLQGRVEEQFNDLRFRLGMYCPRCEKNIDSGLHTLKEHQEMFCPLRADAGPIKDGAANEVTHLNGVRCILASGPEDHVRRVPIIEASAANEITYFKGVRCILASGPGDHMHRVRIIEAAAAPIEDKGKGCASCGVYPCRCAAPQDGSASDSYEDDTPIGDEHQAEIPALKGRNDLYALTTIDDDNTVDTVDGVVEPRRLDRIQSIIEKQREDALITQYPERACADSPSPPRRRKRQRSGAGAAPVAVQVPVAVSGRTRSRRAPDRYRPY